MPVSYTHLDVYKRQVLAKIEEEIAEIRHEMVSNAPPERLADELGDVLFACANLARHLQIDPEAVSYTHLDVYKRQL